MARKPAARKDPAERVIGALINLAHAIEYMAQKIPQPSVVPVAPPVDTHNVDPANPQSVIAKYLLAKSDAPPKPVSGIRYEELAAAVLKVAEVKGQSAAVAILKSFGATHAKQIDEGKYGDALKAFEAALAAPVALA